MCRNFSNVEKPSTLRVPSLLFIEPETTWLPGIPQVLENPRKRSSVGAEILIAARQISVEALPILAELKVLTPLAKALPILTLSIYS